MGDSTRCPACGLTTDPTDTACRRCGAGLPTAATLVGGPATAPAVNADAHTAELREALAPGLQLLQPLGAGGMGTVYLARDPLLRRLVAVKVLAPALAGDEASRKRFIREAAAAAAVAHPNVVGVYQVGELPASGTTYFVMQYVDGPTLQAEFPEGVAIPEVQARRIVGEVATALAAAHARGLVHRDIKPANVMLDRESGRVVVLDFGISAVLERRSAPGAEKLTAEGQSLGTPQYMSPEQAAARPVTDRSDVYSLGAVAFELVTGRPPFKGETAWDLIAAHIKEPAPPVATLRPDLDPQFASLIDRCLRKDPVQRPSADEMARALLPTAHAVIEWPPPGLERLRGSGARLAAALGAMTAVGALFFVTLLSQPPLGDYTARPGLVQGRMWLFALGAYLVTLALCAMAATVRALRLADHLKHGRRSAYPWLVLLDAAWDHSPHSGALLNGTGIFALVAPERRSRLLRLRRLQALLVALTLALGFLLPLLWTAGLLGGWAGDGTRLLPSVEIGVVLAPMLLCGLAALACAQPERLLLRLAEPDWRQRWQRRLVPVRAEVVDAWLHAFGGAGRTRGRLAYRALVFGVPSLLAAALTIGLGAAAAAAFVADELRRSADPSDRTACGRCRGRASIRSSRRWVLALRRRRNQTLPPPSCCSPGVGRPARFPPSSRLTRRHSRHGPRDCRPVGEACASRETRPASPRPLPIP